ncbi:MAG TPA: succinate dehydrogenase/fumarate reductase flavoprotein subunit, partial [Actinomycetota bacterium]|nr:succinate dehydrogenase/fumarate reductase flavoprotein subunit [Actinomycetota bacterium]
DVSTARIRATMQDEMMDKASVVRTEDSLSDVLGTLRDLRTEYAQARVKDRSKVFNTELTEHIELGFMLDMAEALVISARARTESRGGHYREDYQERDDDNWLRHTFITKTPEGETRLGYRGVAAGRYEPVERKY